MRNAGAHHTQPIGFVIALLAFVSPGCDKPAGRDASDHTEAIAKLDDLLEDKTIRKKVASSIGDPERMNKWMLPTREAKASCGRDHLLVRYEPRACKTVDGDVYCSTDLVLEFQREESVALEARDVRLNGKTVHHRGNLHRALAVVAPPKGEPARDLVRLKIRRSELSELFPPDSELVFEVTAAGSWALGKGEREFAMQPWKAPPWQIKLRVLGDEAAEKLYRSTMAARRAAAERWAVNDAQRLAIELGRSTTSDAVAAVRRFETAKAAAESKARAAIAAFEKETELVAGLPLEVTLAGLCKR